MCMCKSCSNYTLNLSCGKYVRVRAISRRFFGTVMAKEDRSAWRHTHVRRKETTIPSYHQLYTVLTLRTEETKPKITSRRTVLDL